MEIQEYLNKRKEFQQNILEYIDKNENLTDFKQNLSDLFKKSKYSNNRHEINSILYLIAKIAENHHHTSHFIEKIESIIEIFKQDIQEIFSNNEIFKIFSGNKRILLYLYEEHILSFDSSIASQFLSKKRFLQSNYSEYFYQEIKPFLNEELFQKVNKNQQYLKEILENGLEFDRKRRIGENYNYICKIIRKDLIKKFVEHVNKTNYSLNSTIPHSVFETNTFLADKKPSLIEYTAFYGSVEIFKFLVSNNVEIKPSLWLYAIHGANMELIHFLVENKIQISDETFENCICESIKCHHNDIANYFIENLEKMNQEKFVSCAIESFNYFYFTNDLNNKFYFFNLCKYNHVTFVDLLLRMTKIDVNDKIVFLLIFFMKFQISLFFIEF